MSGEDSPDRPIYRPPSVEDGTVSEGLVSALQYLIGEYGYAGVMRTLEQLRERVEADDDTISRAFKRGFRRGWNTKSDEKEKKT